MTQVATGLLAGLLLVVAGSQAEDAETLLVRSRDAISRGEPDNAVGYLEKAVALRPDDAESHYRLASAYGMAAAGAGMLRAMPLARKMRAELERAIQLDPTLLPARFMLLEFHVTIPSLLGGSEPEALEQATAIRKIDPIEGRRAFARIYSAGKDPERARQEYLEMLAEQPMLARVRYYYGVYLMLVEKDYRSAGEEFEAAARFDSSYLPAYFQIGHVAALAGNNLARGEEALKRYLQYRPGDDEPSIARAHYWLGAVLETAGDKTEARSNYAASLRINPNQKDVRAAIMRVADGNPPGR